MASVPPRTERRRARPGSLQRPVNGRLYRGTWMLVGLPLLLAAFTVARPTPLPRAFLPAFDGETTKTLAKDLPDKPFRYPGSLGAADWFREQLAPYGLPIRTERFAAVIPRRGGRGVVRGPLPFAQRRGRCHQPRLGRRQRAHPDGVRRRHTSRAVGNVPADDRGPSHSTNGPAARPPKRAASADRPRLSVFALRAGAVPCAGHPRRHSHDCR